MDSPVLLRRFGPGDVIVRPEEPALSVFIVHTGVVEVRAAGNTRRLGAGEMFGEAGVILGDLYGIEAVAHAETAVVAVTLEELQSLCLKSTDFTFRLIRHLAEQLRASAYLAGGDPREQAARLASVILDLAAQGESPAPVDGRLCDLADAARLPMIRAYRFVQDWLEARTLHLADDQLSLAEPDALREIAEPTTSM